MAIHPASRRSRLGGLVRALEVDDRNAPRFRPQRPEFSGAAKNIRELGSERLELHLVRSAPRQFQEP